MRQWFARFRPSASLVRRITQALVGIALVLLVLAKMQAAPVSGFLLAILLLFLSSLYWWSWVDERIQQAFADRPTHRRRVLLAWRLFMVCMAAPLFSRFFLGRNGFDSLPVPMITAVMLWHMTLVATSALMVTVTVLAGLYRLVLRWPARGRASEAASEDPADPPVNASRRELLVRVGAVAPLMLAGGGVAASVGQTGRFRIRREQIALPRLPARLQGLTITQISDVHVGRLFRPEHLPGMVDACNALKSDIVVVTGDLIDHSNDFLPAACDAIDQLEHRYGRYVVVGNHDLIDSGREFMEYLGSREAGVMIDRHIYREIGGEPVQIAGLFWAGRDKPAGRDPGHVGRASLALEGWDPQVFTMALAHHPHAFDALADRGVDLTLAGHTHGGQFMLTPPGARMPLGAGSLMFRYIWGQYARGRARLNVSAGVGNWFPLRINAPAEIVQIRLV